MSIPVLQSTVALQSTETLRAVCHLVTTNIPANAQDSTHIRKLLDNIEEETAQLKSQHHSIQLRLRQLERERQFFKPMLSPLRRVPPEILGEVFAWVLEDLDGDPQRALARLCQVCKSWRQAAHLVPRFWQVTTVNVLRRSLSYEAISSWMSRSRNLPRTLLLSGEKCGESTTVKAGGERSSCLGGKTCRFSKEVLARLLNDGPSLNQVSLACATPRCFQNFSRSILSFSGTASSSWHTIPSFCINADWEDEWKNLPPSVFYFLPCSMTDLQLYLPNIHALDVHQAKIDIPRSLLQHLTTFKLTCNWTANHVLKLLQHCLNLEKLELDLDHGTFDQWSRGDPFMHSIAEAGIVLPKLHTLGLDKVYIPAVADLLFLKLPVLRSLSIIFGNEDWYVGEEDENIMTPQDGSDFASFLRGKTGSPPTLESLSITNGVFEEDTLFDVLKGLSSLKHLTVDNAIFSADVFSKISSQRLLPQLKSLDLPLLHNTQEEVGGLQQLVENRRVKLTMVPCTSSDCCCKDPV